MAEAASSQAKTMSVEEAGKVYFDVSRATAYKLANSGQLPIIKIGRLLRVSVPALERMPGKRMSHDGPRQAGGVDQFG